MSDPERRSQEFVFYCAPFPGCYPEGRMQGRLPSSTAVNVESSRSRGKAL